MSMFELEKAESWVNDMCVELEIGDEQLAQHALRVGLHALRDRLSVSAAAHLGVQLPAMIRGIFFEGWNPASKHRKKRGGESFLEDIDGEMQSRRLAPELVARSLFAVIDRHVEEGVVEHLRDGLPRNVEDMWRSQIVSHRAPAPELRVS
jgi:uncharacterized protein (DUF2267 family)